MRDDKGRFLKGYSGRAGRGIGLERVRALARTHTDEAIATLHEIMIDPSVDPRARVSAAEKLLDRGYGRPSQQVDHSGDLALRHDFAVDGRQAQAIAREFLIGVVPTQGDDGDAEEQESEDDDGDDEPAQKVSTIRRVLRSTDATSDE